MVFVFPFTPTDMQAAEAWLQWAIELGGCKTHEMILMPAKAIKEIDTMRELAGAAFENVSVLRDAEGIEGHPQGPNSCMRQAIWHCQVHNIGPWTFMEPDCIPRTSDWADQWEREYRAFSKPFMGEFRPASGVTPNYLTGNMVIPRDGLLIAPMLSRRGLSIDGIELAFDIVAANETLPNAHLTKLLQQVPKNPDGSSHSFPDVKSLELLRPGAVLFHPCKDGSLIERLREQKLAGCVSGLNVSPSRDVQERGALASRSALPPEGSTPSTAISDREQVLMDQLEEMKRELSQFKSAASPKRRTVSPAQLKGMQERMAKARAAKAAKK